MKNLCITALFLIFGLSCGQAQHSKLPEMVSAYISQLFPDEKIKKVEVGEANDWEVYEIKLSRSTELSFNQNNQPTKIKSKNGIPVSGLPVNVTAYVTQNYPNEKIIVYEMDKDGHKVELESGKELEFDTEGDFITAD